jgi:hypothetical protein
VDILPLWVLLVRELWLDPESVSTEVITLGLEKVGWKVLGAVTIEPVQCGCESRGWDTEKSGLGNDVSPSWLSLVDSLVEEVVEEQVLEVGVCSVSGGDILQEDRADNASSTPHESDGWLVQLPLVFLGGLLYKVSNLCFN